MSDKVMRRLLAIVVAVGLAVAVSYGLISQQTADKIQTTADQAIQGNQTTAPQQPAPPQSAPQSPTIPTPPQPAPQAPAPAPRP